MAIGLIGLCLEVAAFQIEGGRHFVLESLSSSSSWKLPEMIDFVISCLPFVVDASACRFGKKDLESNMFFGKKWRFMTNSKEIAQELNAQYGDAAEARRDDDDAQSMTVPQHVGGIKRSVWSQAPPPPLVKAMLRGKLRSAEGEC